MDVYEHALMTMDRDWVVWCLHDVMWNNGKRLTVDDRRAFCRWLRGFHAHTYNNNGDFWANWTVPGQKEWPVYFTTFITQYMAKNWCFVVDHLPVPSSPATEFEPPKDYREIVEVDVTQIPLPLIRGIS